MIDEKRIHDIAPLYFRINKKLNIDLFKKVDRQISFKNNELKLKNQWLILLREAFYCYLYKLNLSCISTIRTALESFLFEILYERGMTLQIIDKNINSLMKRLKKGKLQCLILSCFDKEDEANKLANEIRILSNKYIHFKEHEVEKYHEKNIKISKDKVIESLNIPTEKKAGIYKALVLEFHVPFDSLKVLEDFTELIEKV